MTERDLGPYWSNGPDELAATLRSGVQGLTSPPVLLVKCSTPASCSRSSSQPSPWATRANTVRRRPPTPSAPECASARKSYATPVSRLSTPGAWYPRSGFAVGGLSRPCRRPHHHRTFHFDIRARELCVRPSHVWAASDGVSGGPGAIPHRLVRRVAPDRPRHPPPGSTPNPFFPSQP